MDGSSLALWLLVALTGLSVALNVFVAYELRQLRRGKASMSYWDAVESVHRQTTPPTTRKTYFGTIR